MGDSSECIGVYPPSAEPDTHVLAVCAQPCDGSPDSCPEGTTCTKTFLSGDNRYCIPDDLLAREREPCVFATCANGLVCMAGVAGCLPGPGGDLQCCVRPGSDGGPCYEDGTCDGDLECVSGFRPPDAPPFEITPCGADACCLHPGGLNQVCHSDGTCDPGLTCQQFDDPYQSPCGAFACCVSN